MLQNVLQHLLHYTVSLSSANRDFSLNQLLLFSNQLTIHSLMSWTAEQGFEEDDRFDRASRVNNDPYNSYLSRHSNKPGGIYFLAAISSAFTLFFLYTLWTAFGPAPPGDETGDAPQYILLGVISAVLWAITISLLHRRRATFGGIDFEANGNGRPGATPLAWREEAGLPGQYSNWGEFIFTGFLCVTALALCIYFVVQTVTLDPATRDPDASGPLPLAIFFGLLFVVSKVLFIRAFRRHMLYARYSDAPLLSGVFVEDAEDAL